MINLISRTWLRMIDRNGLFKDYKAFTAAYSGLQGSSEVLSILRKIPAEI